MIDPTPNEQAAIEHGGRMGGEYLDSLGKTDLATFTVEEWATFIDCVVTGYCDRLRVLASTDCNRLDVMKEGAPF